MPTRSGWKRSPTIRRPTRNPGRPCWTCSSRSSVEVLHASDTARGQKRSHAGRESRSHDQKTDETVEQAADGAREGGDRAGHDEGDRPPRGRTRGEQTEEDTAEKTAESADRREEQAGSRAAEVTGAARQHGEEKGRETGRDPRPDPAFPVLAPPQEERDGHDEGGAANEDLLGRAAAAQGEG